MQRFTALDRAVNRSVRHVQRALRNCLLTYLPVAVIYLSHRSLAVSVETERRCDERRLRLRRQRRQQLQLRRRWRERRGGRPRSRRSPRRLQVPAAAAAAAATAHPGRHRRSVVDQRADDRAVVVVLARRFAERAHQLLEIRLLEAPVALRGPRGPRRDRGTQLAERAHQLLEKRVFQALVALRGPRGCRDTRSS